MSTASNIANATSVIGIMDAIDLGPTDSIQFTFAKLQLAQAQLCKDKANNYMKQIENVQAEQKKCAEMLQLARKLQNDAKNGSGNCPWDKNASMMPQDMANFFKEHGLTYDTKGNDLANNKDEWDVAIQSLTTYQESISNKTQTMMVYLQDYINQFNSYTQGASSAIAKGSEVLTTVATGR